jgi:hypothetical protein
MARLTRPVANDGDEQDAFTRWRGMYRWRPGDLHRIKRRANKRDRRDARLRIARNDED